MVNLILWGVLLFMAGVSLWQSLDEAKSKKNLILGVTLPFEAREDPQVLSVLARHKKQQKLAFFLFIPICIGCLFIKELSVSFILWSFAFLLCLCVPPFILVLSNRKLKRLKAQKGWVSPQAQLVRVETVSLSLGRKASVWGYIPPALFCVLAAFLDSSFGFFHLFFAATAVFSFLSARFLYRNKSETVDDDAARTKTLTELRRKRWNRCWLLSAYCAASISLCILLFPVMPGVSQFLILFFSVLFTGACICLERGTRALQQKLTADSGQGWYVDDDDHWLGGVLYYNPHDSHILINQRTGTGSTINLATLTGKVLFAVCILLVLLVPLMMVGISSLDTQPIALTMSENAVQCKAGFISYTVPLAEIETAELVDTLPSSLYRVWGTGMPHYLGGQFQAEGFTSLCLVLDPKVSPYLLLNTTSGKTYLFGMRDANALREFYSELCTQLG